MTDSNDNLARIEAALAATTEIVQRMGERTDARLLQHDLELDEQDERIERIERDHLEHADRMAKLEDIQTDIRQILQMMTSRFAGE
jgi:DNA-directed RNA polymerase sigma subunit (sigma70/sigma32)